MSAHRKPAIHGGNKNVQTHEKSQPRHPGRSCKAPVAAVPAGRAGSERRQRLSLYDQEHDKIYFHGAKSGQKVDALKQNDKVCFTVYGNEHFEPGDWAPYVQSTVVFGRCHLIDDAAATEARVRELGMKYYPGKEEVEKEIALYIKAVQLYEITIEHLTGKQIQEK